MDLEQLESARQRCAKKIIIAIVITLAILAGTFVLLFLGNQSFVNRTSVFMGLTMLFGVGMFIVSTILIVFAIYMHKDGKVYKKLYKAYFVERSLKQIFTDIYYDHNAGMPIEALKYTGMVNTGNVYSSNDYFSGKYHDVALSQADVHIQVRRSDSDGDTYTTIFKGRWMIFEFPKPFSFRLQVVDKHFTARKKPSISPTTKRTIEQISTESPTFNRKFKVYAEDGFEAFYILDPAFIDNIEKLSNSHKGKLLLCFIDNKLSVGIDDRSDAFEPPNPLRRIDEAKEISKVSQDIKSVTDFVDFLKLDHKLFKTKQGAK
ncbi:DUF3137 domain-containing protein [Candidatus Saccharibacteria bacterium]|nr:DUF3137 domain-containing protein [Candidatus Saccharibacteria bacterium]